MPAGGGQRFCSNTGILLLRTQWVYVVLLSLFTGELTHIAIRFNPIEQLRQGFLGDMPFDQPTFLSYSVRSLAIRTEYSAEYRQGKIHPVKLLSGCEIPQDQVSVLSAGNDILVIGAEVQSPGPW